ncbi:MAG: hypothetical protein OEY14_02315 [Myxococcales bacterium]|nr:hypothetical protein [Myxococcales bacterium]
MSPRALLLAALLAALLWSLPSGCSDPAEEQPRGEIGLEPRAAAPEPATPAPAAPRPPAPEPAAPEPAAAERPRTDEAIEAPAPAHAIPAPLGLGQWARYGVTWSDGGRSTMEYRLVGREGSRHWLEIDDTRRAQRRSFRMLVSLEDRSRIESLEIHALMIRGPDGIQTIPPRLVRAQQEALRPFLAVLVADWETLEQEDQQVPAGRFQGCFRAEREIAFGGHTQRARIWYHPAVPLTGMVRFEGRTNGQQMELIGFGAEGATSRFTSP